MPNFMHACATEGKELSKLTVFQAFTQTPENEQHEYIVAKYK